MKYKVSRPKSKARSRIDPLPILAGVLFAGLPLMVSPGGFDQFRAPKTVFLFLIVAVMTGVYFVLRPLLFPKQLKAFEVLVLAAMGYTLLHSLVLGRAGVSLPAAGTVAVFVLLFFLLQTIGDEKTQRKIWLAAGIALALNGLMTVLEYLGLFTPIAASFVGDELGGRFTPAGLISDTNTGGILFALMTLISLHGVVAERTPKIRTVWAAILVCNFLGLAFTRTLTALAALSVCLVLWLFFHLWWTYRFEANAKRKLAFFGLVLVVALGAAALVAQRARVVDRVSEVARQMSRGDWTVATAGRQPIYLITWEMIKDRPLRGSGLNSFPQDFFDYRTGTEYGRSLEMINQRGALRQVHNEYLQIWHELGALGLLFFLALFVLPLWQGFRSIQREEQDARSVYYHGVLLLGLTLLALGSITFFPFHVAVTAAFAVLVLASLQSRQPRPGNSVVRLEDSLPAFLGRPLVRAGLFILLAIVPVYGQMQSWRANREMRIAAFLLANAEEMAPGVPRRVRADEAMNRLNRVERLDPGNYDVYQLKGIAANLLGRYSEAKSWYLKAAQSLPSPEVYTRLAQVHILEGDREKARKYLESALNYNPGHEQALEVMASLNRPSS